ncbi:MAG TPA: YdeI/OmpD-associated family protein [Ohtaekwangia sp.]|nr:YdeI/OmpD-associated family protein [Ohtaekwangia sp.]
MITFTATLVKFNAKGEKSGWTYFEIKPALAQKLKPGTKMSFRVKGQIDNHPIEKTSLLPMGKGIFMMPVNAAVRKAIQKKHGDTVNVQLEVDDRKLQLSKDLMACLKDEPHALAFFKKLPLSHQHYFSKWIESARTAETKTKRIMQTINACLKGQKFGEMLKS